MSLYPHYRPLGVKPEWDHTSLDRDDAQNSLYKYGGRNEKPVEAVAWFEDSGALRRLVADYADGRRSDLRIGKRKWTLSHTTPARSTFNDADNQRGGGE